MDNKNTILLLALALFSINYATLNGMKKYEDVENLYGGEKLEKLHTTQEISPYDEPELLTAEKKAKSKIRNWLSSTWQSVKDQLEERNPRKEQLNNVNRALAELEARRASKPNLELPALNKQIEILKERKRLIQQQIEKEEKASDNTELLNKWFGYDEPTENPSAAVEKWKGF